MSHAIALPPPMTVAAFDAFLAARTDDGAWELVDEQILAMPDPSLDHADIVGNVGAALRLVMPADRRCRVAVGGVRVRVSDDAVRACPGITESIRHSREGGNPRTALDSRLRGNDENGAFISERTLSRDSVARTRMGLRGFGHLPFREGVGGGVCSGLYAPRPGDALRFGALLFGMPLAEVDAGVALPAG